LICIIGGRTGTLCNRIYHKGQGRTSKNRGVGLNKHNPPSQLKISPITAILHKLRGFCSILDLSFSLHLKNGGILHSVNNTTVKMAPKGALDQLGHALRRIIHALAESDEYIGSKIFMAKWDIKDGFWQMCCKD
jgi:hypothetical protein